MPTPTEAAARFAALAADLVRRRRRVRAVPDWTEFERKHSAGFISRNPYDVNSDTSGASDADCE